MKGLVLTLLLVLGVPGVPALAAPESATGPVIDLNRATVEELQSLPGIGLKKAEAIIAHREKRPFTRVTQLLLVKGIGQKTLTRLKPRLEVRLPAPRPGPATAPAMMPAMAAVPAMAATTTNRTVPARPAVAGSADATGDATTGEPGDAD